MDQFEHLTRLLHESAPGLELREYENMTRHTSFRIGGPARLMACPKTEDEAILAVRSASAVGLEPFFLGNGSNLLVSDQGVDSFIIQTESLSSIELCGEHSISAGSGVLLARLANYALKHSLTGLEFAHGIPGSLGGAVTMNAGAYDGEMSQVVTSTRFLGSDGEVGTLIGTRHGFGYRHSAFSDGSRLILSSVLQLSPGDPAQIRARMDELSAKRKSRQPLEYPSAGSTFKRPEGHFAAALIDRCGLKGYTQGGAQVSEKHAGFVINRGSATCADVLSLMDHIREVVFRETGVELEPEIKYLGQ